MNLASIDLSITLYTYMNYSKQEIPSLSWLWQVFLEDADWIHKQLECFLVLVLQVDILVESVFGFVTSLACAANFCIKKLFSKHPNSYSYYIKLFIKID